MPKPKRKPAKLDWPKPRRTQPRPPSDAPVLQTRAWSPRGDGGEHGAGRRAGREGRDGHRAREQSIGCISAFYAIMLNLAILAFMVSAALVMGQCAYRAVERSGGRVLEALAPPSGYGARP